MKILKKNLKEYLGGQSSSAKFWDSHDSDIFKNVRYLNKYERARLQTVPEKYVECMSEKKLLTYQVMAGRWKL